MYCIFTVVYGIPCHNNERSHVRSELIEEQAECESDGFFSPYSGKGDTPIAFGIGLGEFDEACHHVEMFSVPTPTPAQMGEFKKLYDALEPEVKAALDQYGAPRVFFLAGSS
jgi:hypothetical protein